MKDDFRRLLEAARLIKHWDTRGEIANGLTAAGYTVSDQMMTNWKNRGLSKDCKLQTSAIIGYRIPWLETGTGPMADQAPMRNEESTLRAEEPNGVSYFPDRHALHPAVAEVIELMNKIDDIGKGMILNEVRHIAKERLSYTSKRKSSTTAATQVLNLTTSCSEEITYP